MTISFSNHQKTTFYTEQGKTVTPVLKAYNQIVHAIFFHTLQGIVSGYGANLEQFWWNIQNSFES